jgi:hypothetical protein
MAFGKRHFTLPQQKPVRDTVPVQPSVLRAELIAGLRGHHESLQRDNEGIVPSSSVAFLAASLAVMVLHMVALLVGKNHFAAETTAVLPTIGMIYGKDPRSFATLALFASIWSGARAAAAFTLPAHLILRALDIRSVFAYASAAATASAIWLVVRGFSDFAGVAAEAGLALPSPSDWVPACASGVVAGATYRLVAGCRARPR